MSEYLLPGVATANRVPRRFADPEMSSAFNGSKRGASDLSDNLPVQLRERGAAYVLCMRNWLKVIRSDTGRVDAQMIKNEPLGNRSDLLLVESAVGAVFLSGDPNRTMTQLALSRSVPDPAGSLVTTVGDCPEVGRHLETLGRKASSMTGKEPTWFSLDQPLALEGSRDQVRLFSASTVAQHPFSVSKECGS